MATDPATITDRPAPEAPANAPADMAARLYADDTPPAEEPEADAPVEEDEPPVEEAPDEPEAEPIAAPPSWAADAREVFAGLPREAQEIIAARETARDKFVASKANEAVSARKEVEKEAQAILTHSAQHHAAQLQRYAQMLEPQRPDPRLLTGTDEHRALYYQQQADYEHLTAQRDHAQREAQEALTQAEQLEQQQLQSEMAEQNRILAEQVPEWSEPSARAKLLSDLGSIGGELGYTQEQMREARASDIMALRKAAEWKVKAEKLDALNRAKMQPVRAARQAPSPRVATPGAGQGPSRAPQSLAAQLYPNDVRR